MKGQNFRTVFFETAPLQSAKNQYANTQRTGRLTIVGSIRVLCVLRRHQKMQRRACIASCILSSSVVSPRQTPRELARDRAKTKPSPAISGTCTSQCAEGLHFSAFHFKCTAARWLPLHSPPCRHEVSLVLPCGP